MKNIEKISIIVSLLLISGVSYSVAIITYATGIVPTMIATSSLNPAPASDRQSLLINPGGPNMSCYILNTNLRKGSFNQDVFSLETILIKEKLLHIVQPTIYFGNLTFRAIIAFQEKYASDILTPNGLTHGTGYVGSSTRAKLNALYGCGVLSNPIAGLGQHCGGNIVNPPVCQTGYVCTSVPGSNLPFGDVGGTCILNNSLNYRCMLPCTGAVPDPNLGIECSHQVSKDQCNSVKSDKFPYACEWRSVDYQCPLLP